MFIFFMIFLYISRSRNQCSSHFCSTYFAVFVLKIRHRSAFKGYTILKAYIYEAIEMGKAGLKVNLKKNADLIFPKEFQEKLDETPALKTAFEALMPEWLRAYNLYFSEPKQSHTRESRVKTFGFKPMQFYMRNLQQYFYLKVHWQPN